MPTHGGINVHASLLPKYRGAAPVAYAIFDGEKQTGVTIIKMTPGLDAGDMLAQEALDILPRRNGRRAGSPTRAAGREARGGGDRPDRAGTGRGREAGQAQVTKAPKLKKEFGLIDWTKPAEQVCNQSARCSRGRPRTRSCIAPAKQPMRVIISSRRYPLPVVDATLPARTFRPRSAADLIVAAVALRTRGGSESSLRNPRTSASRQEANDGGRVPARPSASAGRPLRAGMRHERHPARAERQPAERAAGARSLPQRDAFVQELLDDACRRIASAAPTAGSSRNWSTASSAAAARSTRCSGRSSAATRTGRAGLWDALRLGAFQLALLTHVPPHARRQRDRRTGGRTSAAARRRDSSTACCAAVRDW